MVVRALQRSISDNTPLLLDSGEASHPGNKEAFSFQTSWFEGEGFLDTASHEWSKGD